MLRTQCLVKYRCHDSGDSPFSALDRERPWEWQVIDLSTNQSADGRATSFEEAQSKVEWFFS